MILPRRLKIILTSKCILSHENSYDYDIGGASSLTPANAIQTRAVNKCPENEISSLVRRCRSKGRNDHCRGPEAMPPNGDIVQVLEKVYAERVNETWTLRRKSCQALRMLSECNSTGKPCVIKTAA